MQLLGGIENILHKMNKSIEGLTQVNLKDLMDFKKTCL